MNLESRSSTNQSTTFEFLDGISKHFINLQVPRAVSKSLYNKSEFYENLISSYHKIQKYCSHDSKLLENEPNAFELCQRISERHARKHKITKCLKSLKIFSLNINGKLIDKLEFGHPVRSYIEQTRPDIIFFLEILTKSRSKCPDLFGYKLHFKSGIQINKRGRPSGGFAVYISDKIQQTKVLRSSSENIISIGIKEDNNVRSWITGIYMRPSQTIDYYEKFLLEVESTVKKPRRMI